MSTRAALTGIGIADDGSSRRRERLAARIRAAADLIDGRLDAAARWRGELRRDVWGRGSPHERARYAAAFDRLAAMARTSRDRIDLELLAWVHDSAVGGREVRSMGVRIGRHANVPDSRGIAALLDRVLARAESTGADPILSATQLHLDLLVVHPYRDGNGRTARLMASYLLLRAGFRSTLATAVEQHFDHAPERYLGALEAFWDGGTRRDDCVETLLRGMLARVAPVASFRARAERLLARATAGGVSRTAAIACAIAFDRDGADPRGLFAGERPWSRIAARLPRARRDALARGLARLRDEERDGRRSEVAA